MSEKKKESKKRKPRLIMPLINPDCIVTALLFEGCAGNH